MNRTRIAARGASIWASWLLLLAAAAAVVATGGARAADEWRTWTSNAGSTIEAKLVASDGKQVTLEKRDGKQSQVALTQLSAADRSYVAALPARSPQEPSKGATTIAGVAAKPGEVSDKIVCGADPKWSYFLYLPKEFHVGRAWPVCFVMSPGGGNAGTLKRYQPAAEHLGMILATSCESRNSFWESDHAMMAMVKDVYAKVPVLEKVAISSGMSGGSRMAYLMSEMDKNVTGVLACASGGGVYLAADSFRAAKLRSDTAICSLIGTNDFNRREAVKSHKGFGKEARLIWFAGKHDWAGPEIIEDGLAEVYGRILERSKDRNLAPLRAEFARKQLAWAEQHLATQPWTALHWGRFLTEFPGGDAAVRQAAAALVASVPDAPGLTKADKALRDFADKHFGDGNTQVDGAEDSARVKDAEKTAALLGDLPHAKLILLMGKPGK